ncbi:IS1 family transposase [Hymenobacter jeollabukensis]|uniref:IS1 family transposase n=1 Tax=Hymenobacter jeollabukensis TaxID=2025313 RepID=A0A5R8WIM6_9BACT|nr:IS1 family transposase [Hymenobacter jeollabukensis]TLM88446.1 IS1 family transposase [Hymenobacter jeollabukensis]
MSLTSILQSPLHSNLTAWLRHHFPNNIPVVRVPITVHKERNGDLSYSRIGTAFDYLFRFQLERINAQFRQEPRQWIAEHALGMVTSSQARKAKTKPEAAAKTLPLVARLESDFDDAKGQYQAFLRSGVLTPELILSCLLLAKLDVVYRTGRPEFAFREVAFDDEAAEIDQVEKLFQAVNWEPFLAQHHCVLNPTFGRAGMLVGGADADIIIDGVLIDLKVTATQTLQRSYLNQLIGYYLLSLMHTKDCEPIYPIHTIALYFPRADYLLKIPVAHYFDQAGYQQRKAEFIGLVRDYNLDLVDWNNNEYLFTDSSAVKYRVDRHSFKCPYCQADKYSINAAGQTPTGRYKYKCKSCNKSFSTVFSEGMSMQSVIKVKLFGYRIDYEETECLEKELQRAAEESRKKLALYEKSRTA